MDGSTKKISSKGQVTIPKNMRDEIGNPRFVSMKLEGGIIKLIPLKEEDFLYYKSMENVLDEWDSEEDDGLV